MHFNWFKRFVFFRFFTKDYYEEDDGPSVEMDDSNTMENEVFDENGDQEYDEPWLPEANDRLSGKRKWMLTGLGGFEDKSLENELDEMIKENELY